MFSNNVNSFVMSFKGDNSQETITSDNCMIESMTITSPPMELVSSFGGTIPMELPKHYTMDMRIIFSDYEMLIEGIKDKKVSNKKVDDCTIRELLFAIRQKQKGI